MDNKIDLKFTSSVDVEKELDTIIGMLKESVENDDRKVTFLNDLRLRQLQFVYACLLYMTRDDEDISVSYKLYDGSTDVEKDLELFNKLSSLGHYSPLEHQATPTEPRFYLSSNFKGWNQFRQIEEFK